jgi:hypothetical protein
VIAKGLRLRKIKATDCWTLPKLPVPVELPEKSPPELEIEL